MLDVPVWELCLIEGHAGQGVGWSNDKRMTKEMGIKKQLSGINQNLIRGKSGK